jgi:chemotaxis protein MotB
MEMEEEEVKCEEGAPGWVVTFGDMMSLLLTFFILLLSFAKLEKTRFKVFASSMKAAFGIQNVTPQHSYVTGRSVTKKSFSLPFNATDTANQLKNIVKSQQQRSPQGKVDIQVAEKDKGVLMSIPFESMFESGRSDIKPEMQPMLDEISRKLTLNKTQVRISAFTDDIPIRSKQYASNDELSAARSVSLVRYLLLVSDGQITRERFETVAFGSNRPIAPNISRINRKRNRRIEILFYTRPESNWQPGKVKP